MIFSFFRSDELLPAWFFLLFIATINLGWIMIQGYQIENFQFAAFCLAILFYFSGRFLYSRKFLKIGSLLHGYGFMMIAWPVMRLFNHLVMTINFSFTDQLLDNADRLLGLSWLGYVRWIDRHPQLLRLMMIAYKNLTLVSLLATAYIVFGYGRERLFEFIRLVFITAIICSSIGSLFPSNGTMHFYELPQNMFKFVSVKSGTYHVAFLEKLRSIEGYTFDMLNLPGLTAFPSYHTAVGIAIIICCRGFGILSFFAFFYSILMIMATPLFGGHYFVDLIAGAMITVFTWLVMDAFAGKNVEISFYKA